MASHFVSKIDKIVPAGSNFISEILSDSDYRNYVQDLEPTAYFRLGETSGTVAIDEINGAHGEYINSPNLGRQGLIYDDPNTAVEFNGNFNNFVDIRNVPIDQYDDLSIIMSFSTQDVGLNDWDNPLLCFYNDLGAWVYVIGITPAGRLRVYSAGTRVYSIDLNNNSKHQLLLTFSNYQGGTVFIDGVNVEASSNIVDFTQIAYFTLARESDNYFTGVIDEFSIYDSHLDIFNAEELYEISTMPPVQVSSGMLVGQRVLGGVVIPVQVQELIDSSQNAASIGFVIRILLSEQITFSDKLHALVAMFLQEQLTLSSNQVEVLTINQALAELLSVDESLVTDMNMLEQLSELLSILTNTYPIFKLTASENISLSTQAYTIATFLHSLQESIKLSDNSRYDAYINILVSEHITYSSNLDSTAIFNLILNESIIFGGLLDLDDNYTFVANTKTLGLSEYINYNFTSISGDLACNKTGIYSLDDDTDSELIEAEIKTGLVDFGTSKQKQVPYVYLGLSNEGDMVLKSIVNYKGIKKERWYKLGLSTTATDTRRVKLGKGVKSDLWQFSITNVDGADFNIDQMEMLPLVLSRRI